MQQVQNFGANVFQIGYNQQTILVSLPGLIFGLFTFDWFIAAKVSLKYTVELNNGDNQ
jgi:hypothetical protein